MDYAKTNLTDSGLRTQLTVHKNHRSNSQVHTENTNIYS